MTKKEKFNAIAQRCKFNSTIKPIHVSVLMILNYMDKFREKGMIDGAIGGVLTGKGQNIQSVFEEFEWIPTDADIELFGKDMIDDPDTRMKTMVLLKAYRDRGDTLFDDFEKSKKG